MSLEHTGARRSPVWPAHKCITHSLEKRGYGRGWENMLRWSSEFTPTSHYLWGTGEFSENLVESYGSWKNTHILILLIISGYAWTLWSPPRNDLIAAFKLKPHYPQLVRVWGPDHLYSDAGLFYSSAPYHAGQCYTSLKVCYPILRCFHLLFTRSDLHSSLKALPA